MPLVMFFKKIANIMLRDVDNSRKPGKLPGCERDFPAVKHYFFFQNVFKCCQKIVIYLFHLFTPLNLGIACQRHARAGLRPKYPPIIARFPPVKNFSYIPDALLFQSYGD